MTEPPLGYDKFLVHATRKKRYVPTDQRRIVSKRQLHPHVRRAIDRRAAA